MSQGGHGILTDFFFWGELKKPLYLENLENLKNLENLENLGDDVPRATFVGMMLMLTRFADRQHPRSASLWFASVSCLSRSAQFQKSF